jgi:hypothetical protein
MNRTVVHMKDVRYTGPRRPHADYEIVELTEALPARIGARNDDRGLLNVSDFMLERVRDPLFQAFVATGFLRPR